MTVASDPADNLTAPTSGWNTNVPDTDVAAFEDVRPRLFGVAYRMLGSVAEAEDVVQEAWLRWQGTDRTVVRNPAAFLTTTTTRLAINAATSAHARRETYVGPWLPEPVDTSADPALGAERAEALDLAVLLLLERLTPAERASYVLREAFDYSHREIADGARHLRGQRAAGRPPGARAARAGPSAGTRVARRARRLLESFVAAARGGDLAELERLLADDVVVRPDGGGEVHASRVELHGPARTVTFLDNILRKYWNESTLRIVDANGGSALLVTSADGRAAGARWRWTRSDRGIDRVLIVTSPSKLRQFAPAA